MRCPGFGPQQVRRAFSFGSRVIRDRLGASCSDASTTALSRNRGAGSIWLYGLMSICFLGIAVALFSPWRKRWLHSACGGESFSCELKALRVFRAETRLTVYRPRQSAAVSISQRGGQRQRVLARSSEHKSAAVIASQCQPASQQVNLASQTENRQRTSNE